MPHQAATTADFSLNSYIMLPFDENSIMVVDDITRNYPTENDAVIAGDAYVSINGGSYAITTVIRN